MSTQPTTPAQFIEQFANQPTPYTDRLVALAKDWKLSDEFIEDERRFEAKTDAYWAARSEDES